jgi:hypothetical protein
MNYWGLIPYILAGLIWNVAIQLVTDYRPFSHWEWRALTWVAIGFSFLHTVGKEILVED